MPAPTRRSTAATQLEVARRDLLDLGRRNRLLNHRPLKGKGLELIDELPREVYRILVAEGKGMTFLPVGGGGGGVEDENLLFGVEQPEEHPGENGPAARHVDTKLQTPYSSKQLQSRLLSTYYAARLSIEETGVNVLYLALGMLQWIEADSSGGVLKAPLILVPVELARTSVQSRFTLKYLGDGIRTNLSLKVKLKQDFAIDLPDLASDEEVDVTEYFRQVKSAVRGHPAWSIEDQSIALGFFYFNKLLMFEDLAPEAWPPEAHPADHSIISVLLGGTFKDESIVEDSRDLDELLSGEDLFQVIDSDESQTTAILDVRRGRHLVIQGPPGTGKSQTIVNLIAQALGAKKTVLFVAEKMAALEVVKRRLDKDVGLGDACLELHSHRSNKRAVLAELKRTLDLGVPELGQSTQGYSGLAATQKRLTAYCRAVNSPINYSSVTPFQAFGNLIRLETALGLGASARGIVRGVGSPVPVVASRSFREWTFDAYLQRRVIVQETEALINRMGVPTLHPFWGCKKRLFLPSERSQIRQAAIATRTAISSVLEAAKSIVEAFGAADPADSRKASTAAATAKAADTAPDLCGVNFASSDWLAQAGTIADVVRLGTECAALRARFQDRLRPEAWDADLRTVSAVLARQGEKWWRAASRRFWWARRCLGRVLAGRPASIARRANRVSRCYSAVPVRKSQFRREGARVRCHRGNPVARARDRLGVVG
ncbi:MAG: DUF4011 domain-containing protein [Thermoanaerobaculaceae bacterium]